MTSTRRPAGVSAEVSEVAAQRRSALKARRALSLSERARCSRDACARLARLPVFRRACAIGFYAPLRGEADPRPLMARLRPDQIPYLPRVVGDTLRFIAVPSPRFRRRTSALGISEPLGGPARRVDRLDLLVMPLVAFDDRAQRIGMGGGYYDRTLADYARRRGFRGPRLIGLAFEVQRVDRIQARPWDIDLDMLVTEARVYRALQAHS